MIKYTEDAANAVEDEFIRRITESYNLPLFDFHINVNEGE